MNFEKLNNKTIKEAFIEFDKANGQVWTMFENAALKWINNLKETGLTIQKIRISSKTIITVIRYNKMLQTKSRDFKINDAYTPHYSRKFIKIHPEMTWEENGEKKCVFELRELRSGKGPRQGDLFD